MASIHGDALRRSLLYSRSGLARQWYDPVLLLSKNCANDEQGSQVADRAQLTRPSRSIAPVGACTTEQYDHRRRWRAVMSVHQRTVYLLGCTEQCAMVKFAQRAESIYPAANPLTRG
jgi:hypothetical protein